MDVESVSSHNQIEGPSDGRSFQNQCDVWAPLMSESISDHVGA